MKKQPTSILELLDGKNSKQESSTNFDFAVLMNNVTFEETDTHLHVNNFPSAFGDTQNKNNRVYDQTALKEATNQFQNVKESNPYFCYIFDGHRDEDSYENIIGRIINLKIDESTKCILSDLKINKGAKSYETIANIVKDKDPLGISMRIISPDAINLSKHEIDEINPDVLWLSEDNAGIAQLMSNESEIEFISGRAYIQRFDLTQFPSFNKSWVGDIEHKGMDNKKESGLAKFTEYNESCGLMSKDKRCITDSCRFKRTIKDFIHLISKDESITTIKKYPTLYDDMLKFSYMNLSEFDFDGIIDERYLSNKLDDIKLDKDDVAEWIDTIKQIVGPSNILTYLTGGGKLDASKFIMHLNNTVNKIIDVDDIFYQMVTTNYLHQIILSTITLTGKGGVLLSSTNKLVTDLEETANMQDPNVDILVKLLSGIKEKTNIYDFTNVIFTYIYGYLNKYADAMAPVTVINESFKRFKVISTKSLFKQSFVKK